MKTIVAALAMMAAAMPLFAEQDAPPQVVKAERPKPKPRRAPLYMEWAKASEAAAAYNQPIVVFIGSSCIKEAGKLRNATVAHKAFKDIATKSCILYAVYVPEEMKEVRCGRRTQRQRTGKPDFNAVKSSEKATVSKFRGKGSLPLLMLVSPGGSVINPCLASPADETPFCAMIEALKPELAKANPEYKLPMSVENAMKKERSEAAKRAKKKK